MCLLRRAPQRLRVARSLALQDEGGASGRRREHVLATIDHVDREPVPRQRVGRGELCKTVSRLTGLLVLLGSLDRVLGQGKTSENDAQLAASNVHGQVGPDVGGLV